MIRYSSRRFVSRHDLTYPERSTRLPRVTRQIELVSSRSGPRSGASPDANGAVRR